MQQISSLLLALTGLASVSAFLQPNGFTGTKLASTFRSSTDVKMAVEDMLGADVETNGVWDPLGLSKNEASLAKYRASEIKHGRVAMLACLGEFVQSFTHLPDEVFSESRPLAALRKVSSERPEALWQIVLFTAAMELYFWKQDPDMAPGDVGGPRWARYQDPEVKARKLTKELKNGRLAMVAIIGMWYQEYLTGQGPIEQIVAGHTLPFGDGQGYF